MDGEGWLMLIVGVSGGAFSLFALWSVIHHVRRVPPEKISRFVIGYGGMFFFLGFPCWILAVSGLIQLGAPRPVTLVMAITVNVLMQPLLLHMLVTTAWQLVKELREGPYFGGKVIPREKYTPAEYRRIYWHCLTRDFVGILVCAALSLVCLTPWL